MQLIAAERRGEEAKGSAAPLAIEGVCLGFEGIDLEINGGGDLIRCAVRLRRALSCG